MRLRDWGCRASGSRADPASAIKRTVLARLKTDRGHGLTMKWLTQTPVFRTQCAGISCPDNAQG